ncbi:hypothetical protein ACJX0J_020437, partial [Zea mays]
FSNVSVEKCCFPNKCCMYQNTKKYLMFLFWHKIESSFLQREKTTHTNGYKKNRPVYFLLRMY